MGNQRQKIWPNNSFRNNNMERERFRCSVLGPHCGDRMNVRETFNYFHRLFLIPEKMTRNVLFLLIPIKRKIKTEQNSNG